MIPYGQQKIDEEDIKEVVGVLRSAYLTCGPAVEKFEKNVARYVSSKYAVASNNGTSALHLMYLAAGLKEGDEVITAPNTFAATANMLMAIGAKPVFCDIRLDTYNLDETKIEPLITARTRAIAPVHFAGHPCEMNFIWEVARRYNLMVLEDAAHALGARYENKLIGSGESDMTIFSFHPVKPITTGEGGMIVTNNAKLDAEIRLLRSHGIKKDENGFNVMSKLGFNYRLTDIQAALGSSQLKKLDRFLKQRHDVVEWYYKKLHGLRAVILPQEKADCYSGWHLYVIRTRKPEDRLPLYQYLLKKGIGVNFHYPPIFWHPYYRDKGFNGRNCPLAEEYGQTAITLPLYPGLTERDIEFIASSVKDYFLL